MEPSKNPQPEKGDTSNMEEFLQALRDIQSINAEKLRAHLSQSSKQTNPDVGETLLPTSAHALESQRRETERLRKKLEEEKDFREEYFNVFGRKEMKDLNKMIENMDDEIKRLQEDKTKLDEKNKSLETEMQKAITEKNNAMARLRRQMGNQVTDHTPNIADMSDQNGPNKLGKRYTELYDTQWTDAFELLTETQKQKEKNAIEILLKVLIECHNFAKMRAEKQMNELVQSISGDSTMQVGDAIKRELKNARKLMDVGRADLLFLECERYVKARVRLTTLYLFEKEMKQYLIECFQVCWLMAIQDPPSVLGKEAKYTEDFNIGLYKPYNTSGSRVDFVVWPPLLLHEGGPLLAKGVAHSIQEKSERVKTHRNAWDDEDKIGIREKQIGGTTEHYPVQLSSTTTRPGTNDGQLNTNFPQTSMRSLSSRATTSNLYSSTKGNQRSTTELSQSSRANYGMELVGTSYKQNSHRESMNKSTQSQDVLSPHTDSASTSYEVENETRGHLSATGQTAKPNHFYERGTSHGYAPLQKCEREDFISFVHMYDREGESVTRNYFYDKYDIYHALYLEFLQKQFGEK